MIGSGLEGADLESRVASWAASAISDDAPAVRAVLEAYGDRLAAADVADIFSQCTGSAAVMHAVHVQADAGAVRRGLLRHLASPPPGFGHVPHPLAVAEHDAATPTSARTGARQTSA